ncbi:MAG: DinB family protein [Bacteroidetes bacterium]|jgi:hypothetical protein|nr:DinB family protein [Bacteroidota bacterium]
MSNWSEQIDEITENFIQTFGSLTPEQLNWKPDPKTWSIAQNIEHLITINSTYFPVIQSVKDGTYEPPFIAKFGFITSFFGNMLYRAVQPNRKWKSKTMPMWEPTQGDVPEGILKRFEDHQDVLKKRMDDAQDVAEEGAIISSPANKNLIIKLEKAFDIIIAHEKRHYEQSKEVLRAIKNQS